VFVCFSCALACAHVLMSTSVCISVRPVRMRKNCCLVARIGRYLCVLVCAEHNHTSQQQQQQQQQKVCIDKHTNTHQRDVGGWGRHPKTQE